MEHELRTSIEDFLVDDLLTEVERSDLGKLLARASAQEHLDQVYALARRLEALESFDNSIALLDSALERPGVARLPGAGLLLYSKARAQRQSGDHNGALASLDQLDEAAQRHGDVTWAGIAAEERTSLLLQLGALGSARRTLDRHLARSSTQRSTRLALLGARFDLERGRASKAAAALNELLDSEGGPDPRFEAFARTLYGESLLANGDVEDGLRELGRALESEQLGGTALVFAGLAMARAQLDSGDLPAAAETLGGLETGSFGALFAARFAATRWRLADRAGAGEVERTERLLDLRRTYDELLVEWRRIPLSVADSGFLAPLRRRLLIGDVLCAEATDAARADGVDDPRHGARTALTRLLEAQACGGFARRIDAGPVTATELERQLAAEGGGLLVFVPGVDELYTFGCDGSGTWLETTDDRAELDAAADAAERLLAPQADWEPAAATAFDALTAALLPAERRKQIEAWGRLRVDGLDLVTSVPATLLRTESAAWFGTSLALSRWPSAVVAHGLCARGSTASAASSSSAVELLALLDPEPGADPSMKGLPRLDFDADERADIAQLFEGPVELKIGRSARLDAVRSARPRFLWIHAHGVVDRSRSDPVGLALAEDEVVWPSAIEATIGSNGPELAFVAACESGAGDRRFGNDDASPLALAWISCGATDVVVADRAVRHSDAKAIGLRFWRAIEDGARPDESLRRARAARAEEREDPRAFAHFALIGSR